MEYSRAWNVSLLRACVVLRFFSGGDNLEFKRVEETDLSLTLNGPVLHPSCVAVVLGERALSASGFSLRKWVCSHLLPVGITRT